MAEAEQAATQARPRVDISVPDLLECGVTQLAIKLQVRDSLGDFHSIGTAHVQLLKRLGRGVSADVFQASVLSYQIDAAAAASHPPPWGTGQPPSVVAVKVLRRQRAEMTQTQHVHPTRPDLYQEVIVMSTLKSPGPQQCFVAAYGYGTATAAAVLQQSGGRSSSGGGGSSSGANGSQSQGLNGYESGVPAIIMQWADLGSVAQLLQLADGSPCTLSANKTAYIMQCVCTALAEQQRQGFFELDLKPEHLLLASGSSQPDVLLCGFGCTRGAAGSKSFVENYGTVGTKELLPPDDLFLGIPTCVWQLGLLLLRCRGGCALPPGFRSMQALRQSPSFNHLLPLEWELLELCLAPNAARRPPPSVLLSRKFTMYFWQDPDPTQPSSFSE